MTTLDAARQARFRQRRKERLELAEDVANALERVLDYPQSAVWALQARELLDAWRETNSRREK